MIPVFEEPLKTMFRPENRAYTPASQSDMPSADALDAQLEGRWKNLTDLPIIRQRAFHQLATRATRRKVHDGKWSFLTLTAQQVPAEVSLEELAGEAPVSRPTVQETTPAAIHFDDEANKLIAGLAEKHAYVATVTVALIEVAKKASGILPSSEFLWSRGKDPAFWLMINGYGRIKQKAAVVGVFAQYHLEKKLGTPCAETYFHKEGLYAPEF